MTDDDRAEFEAARAAGLRQRHVRRLTYQQSRKATMTETMTDAALVHSAADLLYDADDPRATPWPDPTTLGRIRSRLRNIALGLHPHCDDPANCGTDAL